MTNSMNYQNKAFPCYSGVTINITNPTLNAPPMNANCPHGCAVHNQTPMFTVDQAGAMTNTSNTNTSQVNPNAFTPTIQAPVDQAYIVPNTNQAFEQKPQAVGQQAYPPNYYLNNYNYINNGEHGVSKNAGNTGYTQNPQAQSFPPNGFFNQAQPQVAGIEEDNLASSREIIQNLDNRLAEQKELEKNGKKTKVVALTNEYIMSLEKYLDNPNSEIRLMASKEVLTRLDEDHDRFNDAALNALLNKMLQDPNKLVRIAALSAFSSQLASGNDYTIQLLNNIKNNPNSDKEDVIQVADIMLKMASTTETRYVPVKQDTGVMPSNVELENLKQQNEQLRTQLGQYKENDIAAMLQAQQGQQ